MLPILFLENVHSSLCLNTYGSLSYMHTIVQLNTYLHSKLFDKGAQMKLVLKVWYIAPKELFVAPYVNMVWDLFSSIHVIVQVYIYWHLNWAANGAHQIKLVLKVGYICMYIFCWIILPILLIENCSQHFILKHLEISSVLCMQVCKSLYITAGNS